MAVTIISPTNSFVRFNETEPDPLCIWGDVNFCLPVYDQEDVYFQFVIQGTELEIDSLCTQTGDEVTVELVSECGGSPLITFSEKPDRFRLSETQVLYNWQHGFPAFTGAIAVGQCFKIQLTFDVNPYGYPSDIEVFCSNCFERIGDDCYTSVVEFGNDEDAFGYKYCYGGGMPGSDVPAEQDCEPTITTFASVATLTIPYTAYLQSKYGDFPTVQVWIYDGTGQLINMGITAGFDAYPPTVISFDFGGPASGIVVMR